MGSLALKLLSMWPEMTWELVLITARLAESTRSFDKARMIASYSALLSVHWNTSLAAYLSLILDGEVRIAVILALVDPHALLVCIV